MALICTPCGEELPDGHQAIFGIERDGEIKFGWTCCHKPVGDVAIVLASLHCMQRWIVLHPEHESAIREIFSSHQVRDCEARA